MSEVAPGQGWVCGSPSHGELPKSRPSALVASPFFWGVPLVPDLNSAPIDNRRVADLKMGDESGWQTQGILCVPIQSSSGLQQRRWAPKDFQDENARLVWKP